MVSPNPHSSSSNNVLPTQPQHTTQSNHGKPPMQQDLKRTVPQKSNGIMVHLSENSPEKTTETDVHRNSKAVNNFPQQTTEARRNVDNSGNKNLKENDQGNSHLLPVTLSQFQQKSGQKTSNSYNTTVNNSNQRGGSIPDLASQVKMAPAPHQEHRGSVPEVVTSDFPSSQSSTLHHETRANPNQRDNEKRFGGLGTKNL
jgi:hypothetical protein